MIWIILIAIVGFIIIKFILSMSKDIDDLQGQSLSEKFSVIVNLINQSAFHGKGNLTVLDKREFNLYENGQNQLMKFLYSTGHLTIIWKYKYYQKEIIHEKQFNDVRNLSIFDQQKIAEKIILEMADIVQEHKKSVIGNI